MPADKSPSVEFVRQALRYEDGRLYWLERPRDHFRSGPVQGTCNTKWAGKEAGKMRRGQIPPRWVVCLNYQEYLRYRIVWVLCNGEWPAGQIDHVDRNPLNDRIENLRLATPSQNQANQLISRRNTSGYKGAYWRPERGHWTARIIVQGKKSYLGSYATPEEAHAAYMAAAREHFGEFACEG